MGDMKTVAINEMPKNELNIESKDGTIPKI